MNKLTFTLGEKLGLNSDKADKANKVKHKPCGCGRDKIEFIQDPYIDNRFVAKYCVFSGGKTLDGRNEYVPACKICYEEESEMLLQYADEYLMY